MNYQDQTYYKEFRTLLNRLQKNVSDIKSENQDLVHENQVLRKKLQEVLTQLTETQKEADRVKKKLLTQKASGSDKEIKKHPASGGIQQTDPYSPTLFDNLGDNEKIVLRQQIMELISRIEKHLDKPEKS